MRWDGVSQTLDMPVHQSTWTEALPSQLLLQVAASHQTTCGDEVRNCASETLGVFSGASETLRRTN